MSIIRGKRTVAVVTVTDAQGRSDSESKVRSLEALFEACRDAPPSRLVRVLVLGPDGEVRLHFASFRRKGRT